MDWGTEVKSRGQHSRVGEKEGGWDRVEGGGCRGRSMVPGQEEAENGKH